MEHKGQSRVRWYSLWCHLELIQAVAVARYPSGPGREVRQLAEQVWRECLAGMGSGWFFCGRPRQYSRQRFYVDTLS